MWMNHRELAEHERLVSSLRAHLERALERLEDAREQLARERADHGRSLETMRGAAATLEERTRALASAQAQLDWMAQTITSLNVERAALFQARWGVSVPVGEVVSGDPGMDAATPRDLPIGDLLDRIARKGPPSGPPDGNRERRRGGRMTDREWHLFTAEVEATFRGEDPGR